MEIRFLYQGQHFIWNAEKAATNLLKHGISCQTACEIFFDPFVRLTEADDSGEKRAAALGLAEDWSLLFVVHLLREEDSIRIISARQATSHERKAYEEGE
ncbi:BrnT family toxin [Paracidobacterium acidisoli]|uniref:BrnT family toxin n=1 Tax=Paracidobacterium acidisoli TaxID=2303751 RepID=A0A372IMM9_9BACT|nr:BrnT family toxin [Paracidobacterium acidisoli]MBT9331790.1 BrnT family toxin [Paracidobacterium acidisoli]